MREGYRVTIDECSRELSHKERVKLMDTTPAVRIDKVTSDNAEGILIDPDYYAVISVHNEHSDDKDYNNYLIIDKDGTRYLTGSESFWSSFMDIMEEMKGSDEEFKVRAYRVESKNRPGKQFITCEIV